jgi:uncharacterized membrane protein YcaP (DUF421 family)
VFFDSWQGLMRVLTTGTCAYLSLVLLLRISGKRTLSKLNAFDLIVTIALGSILATLLLSRDVPLLEGIAAFALLVCLQAAITALSVRSKRVSGWVKSEPTLLVFRGRILEAAMTRERVTFDEVLAALRASGVPSLEQAHAVVLETDGTLSVLQHPSSEPATAPATVCGATPHTGR